MPRNRNRNKNFNNNNNNNRNNNQFHYNGGVNNNKNRFNRKIFLKPSKLEALQEDYEFDQQQQKTSNNYHQNRNFHSNNNINNNNNNRKNKKENKRRVFENLKEMGMVKSSQSKLSIGDTDNEIKKALLESKPHCKLNNISDELFNLIVNYVQKYFTCYDSNREGLLNAYNPKCSFSISINTSSHCSNRTFKFDDISFKENRNLKRLNLKDDYNNEKKFKLLHQGYIDTVNFLSKLPPSEHDPRSFKLDSCFFTDNIISFSLTGVFKEGKSTDKVRPLRSFYRVFVCVPSAETSMSIVNEQFLISHVTSDQYKTYFQTNVQQQQQQQQQYNEPSASTSASSSVQQQDFNQNLGLNDQQMAMIQQFSADSRLNIEWSKYCLEHSGWNYEEAAKNFTLFKESIPKEAYL